jgi:hypothetical protein
MNEGIAKLMEPHTLTDFTGQRDDGQSGYRKLSSLAVMVNEIKLQKYFVVLAPRMQFRSRAKTDKLETPISGVTSVKIDGCAECFDDTWFCIFSRPISIWTTTMHGGEVV